MKGDNGVIKHLNKILKNELTAINQYHVHARLLDNWGIKKYAEHELHESGEEREHADLLIQRIILLEGPVNVQEIDKVILGKGVKEIIQADLKAEERGIKDLRAAIAHCLKVGDDVSYQLLGKILKDEESHVDQLESYLWQIDSIGLENFIQTQI